MIPTPAGAWAGLPGDPTPRQRLERMIRLDHAGAFAAARIHAGQMRVLRHNPAAATLGDGQAHRDAFAGLLANRRVRPSALLPVWHVAGFALGAITGALGPRAATACIDAVQEAIDEHYAQQAAALDGGEAGLRTLIETFHAAGNGHRDPAAPDPAPGHGVLTRVIKAGCKLAIAASERV